MAGLPQLHVGQAHAALAHTSTATAKHRTMSSVYSRGFDGACGILSLRQFAAPVPGDSAQIVGRFLQLALQRAAVNAESARGLADVLAAVRQYPVNVLPLGTRE